MALLASLVACSVVAASPAWLIVPGDAEESSALASAAVSRALTASGHGGEVAALTHEARACVQRPQSGQAACFLAAAPGARVLVVNGVTLRDRFALTVAVLGKNGSVLEEAGDKGALTDVDALAVSSLAALSRSLNARESSDAPVVAELVPLKTPEVVIPAAPVPAAPSRAPAWVATGVAVVAAGVAVSFLAVGLSEKSSLEGTQPGALRHSEAMALAQQANTHLSISLGAGAGAAAAGVVSGILWGAP